MTKIKLTTPQLCPRRKGQIRSTNAQTCRAKNFTGYSAEKI